MSPPVLCPSTRKLTKESKRAFKKRSKQESQLKWFGFQAKDPAKAAVSIKLPGTKELGRQLSKAKGKIKDLKFQNSKLQVQFRTWKEDFILLRAQVYNLKQSSPPSSITSPCYPSREEDSSLDFFYSDSEDNCNSL